MILVAVGVTLVGCGAKEADAPRASGTVGIQIGLILPDIESETAKPLVDFAKSYASKNNAVLNVIQAKTKDEVSDAIAQASGTGSKGLIIDANDSKMGDTVKTQIEFFKLKAVSFNTRLQTMGGSEAKYLDMPFVGADEESIGASCGTFSSEEIAKRGWTKEGTSFVIIADAANAREKNFADYAKEAISFELGIPKNSILVGKSPTAANLKTNVLIFSTSAASLAAYVNQLTASGRPATNISATAVGDESTMKAVNASSAELNGTLLVSYEKQFQIAFDKLATGLRKTEKIPTFPDFQAGEFVAKGSTAVAPKK